MVPSNGPRHPITGVPKVSIKSFLEELPALGARDQANAGDSSKSLKSGSGPETGSAENGQNWDNDLYIPPSKIAGHEVLGGPTQALVATKAHQLPLIRPRPRPFECAQEQCVTPSTCAHNEACGQKTSRVQIGQVCTACETSFPTRSKSSKCKACGAKLEPLYRPSTFTDALIDLLRAITRP